MSSRSRRLLWPAMTTVAMVAMSVVAATATARPEGSITNVSWADSRFRPGAANDVVYSTSTDGQTWTAPVRVPIDATGSGTDHYFPELVVDGTKLGLFYYEQSATCSSQTSCLLRVGFVFSTNGGSSWSAPQTLAGPFALNLLAQTSQGPMIGDYSGGSMVSGKAVGVFSVGRAPTDGKAYDQAMYTFGPQTITGGSSPVGARLASGPHVTKVQALLGP